MKLTKISILFFPLFIFVSQLCAEPKQKEISLPPPSSVSFTVGGELKTYHLNPNLMAEYLEPGSSSVVNRNNVTKQGEGGWKIHKVNPSAIQDFRKKFKNPQSFTEVYTTSPGSEMFPILFPGILVVRFKDEPGEKILNHFEAKHEIRMYRKLHSKLFTFKTNPGPNFSDLVQAISIEPEISEVYPDISVEKVLR